ncbi:MAG: hypothetical protein J0L92_15700 [Deltaproteobacteria bacterium]|nr:hypothetical protein [Deltaproteobacteria bacterium]
MTIGSVSRSQSVHTTTAAAPPPPPSDAAPIDMSRDVADTTPSQTSRGERTQAAVAIAAPPRTFVDPQIHRAAEAFARDGMPGLERFLRDHPDDARFILSISREHLAEGFRADLGARAGYQGAFGSIRAYIDAEAIDARLVAVFQPRIREDVRDLVVNRLDTMIHGLESMSIDQAVTALRNAPAGSPLAELREAMHMPGNSMDRERVEGWVRASLHELHALRDTAMGQSWMPDEFPGSMAQVQRTMGLERATPHSIAGEALFRGHHGAADRAHAHETAVDTTIVAAEGTHLALEAAHVAATHGGVAAIAVDATVIAGSGGLAVGLGGLAFGYMLHHQIQENRAERTETARQLGL